MTNELFMKIVSAVITIIVALISAFVIPWIKEKIGVVKFNKLVEYTELAVRSAEQLFDEEQWKEKKLYVTVYIKELCNDVFKLSLTDKDIDVLIEGIVNEVKKG